jgi:hypothetical protein
MLKAYSFFERKRRRVGERQLQNSSEPPASSLTGSISPSGRKTFLIIDLPDNVSAAAISFVNNSAGNVRAIYTPLITVEEMDQAIDKATTLASPNPER